MRTKKQGFTLIELLAVIVILAVIALIATPLVMSTINDAKEGALKSTVRAIKDEAEKLHVQKVQSNPSETPVINEGEIEYSGDKIPAEDMKVTFNNSGLANIAVYRDSKCVYKLFNDSDVKVNKKWTKEECLDSVRLGADLLVKKANGSTVTTYVADSDASKQMYTFSHTIGETTTTDYRYIGSAPNNYIKFNGGETWRIIGVFGDNIKIIKDTPVGSMSRDYKKGISANPLGSSVSEYGSNDWTDSQLMYFLNPTTYSLKQGYTLNGNYIKDTNGNIIYEMGKQPALVEAGAAEYTGTVNSWKLSDAALALVDTTTYSLGGIAWSDATHHGGAESMYAAERGTNVWGTRPTSWTGKVGLMYPSDYAYTFAYQSAEGTQICYTDTYSCRNGVWSEVTYTGTPEASWLYNGSISQWTISRYAGDSYYAFIVGTSGLVSSYWSSDDNISVRPVVYLRSDILLTGSGVKNTDPYKIVG